jgi:hypothetical protein
MVDIVFRQRMIMKKHLLFREWLIQICEIFSRFMISSYKNELLESIMINFQYLFEINKTMLKSGVLEFLATIVLILFCHFQSQNHPISRLINMTTYYTSAQLCVQYYAIDLLIYALNCISVNLSQLLTVLALGLTMYGWLVVSSGMKESTVNVYEERKITTTDLLTEVWTSAQGAIGSVWQSLSVIKVIQFVFLVLVLLSVWIS